MTLKRAGEVGMPAILKAHHSAGPEEVTSPLNSPCLHRYSLGVIMRTAKVVILCLLFSVAGAFAKEKRPVAAPPDKSAECLACHSDASLAKDVNGKAVSLHVDEGKFKNSIHGSM